MNLPSLRFQCAISPWYKSGSNIYLETVWKDICFETLMIRRSLLFWKHFICVCIMLNSKGQSKSGKVWFHFSAKIDSFYSTKILTLFHNNRSSNMTYVGKFLVIYLHYIGQIDHKKESKWAQTWLKLHQNLLKPIPT